ncbi:hypothetical protein QEN19_004323 [Hanseniaspora menglaensis]
MALFMDHTSYQDSKIDGTNSILPKTKSSFSVDKDHYNFLSNPLTKEQLREAKKLIDHKIELNNSLPKEQAYLDKEGNFKVAKVTRYIPTNLILTKEGQLVLKNPQQQVDYMDFIGESLKSEENNTKINNNINKINKLMQKVNTLSGNLNNNNNNNIFANDLSNGKITLRDDKSNPHLNSLFDNNKTQLLSSSRITSFNNYLEDNLNGENTLVENSKRRPLNPNQSFQKMQNSASSMRTKSSAESVKSSSFIENNFPVISSVNNSNFTLPKQSSTLINSMEKQAKNSGGSKRLLSNINKKLKTSTANSYTIAQKSGSSLLNSKQNKIDLNKIDLKTYEGLLPWEKHVELMTWIDPVPAFPPSYNKCNPKLISGNLQYPIYEETHNPDVTAPPDYKPGIEGVSIVAMKVEFLSPFDKAMFRHWKYYIFELNSTQINFYHIDEELTKNIENYKDGKDDSCQIREREANNDYSSYTDQYQMINGKKIWNNSYDSHNSSTTISKNAHEEYVMSKLESREILQKVLEKPAKYLTNLKLCKSFSLQNNDFGIATDCNERPYILRMRSEMEQFLLSFTNVMDMINWSVYLSVGIGISLDLDERTNPNYRIVPIGSSRDRRRRRRRLREARRQRMLQEQQEQLNVYSNNLKKQQLFLQTKGNVLNFARLRSTSLTSFTHNGGLQSASDSFEKRRSSLATLNNSLLQDESSSLVELSSTIDAERRRRMSNNQSLLSSDSLNNVESLVANSQNIAADSGSGAVEDEEEEEEDDEYDDMSFQQYERSPNDIDLIAPPTDYERRQTERENRRLMEEYTSLTIRRVLKEDETEGLGQNYSGINSSDHSQEATSFENLDRNNPALVLKHALTNIQFAPDTKKTALVPDVNKNKSGNKISTTESLNRFSSVKGHSTIFNLIGTHKPENNKSTNRIISKLFGKRSSSSNKAEKKKIAENDQNSKKNSDITVENLIRSAPTERRQSIVAVKRDNHSIVSISPSLNEDCNGIKAPVVAKSCSVAFDSNENSILAEERNIMEEELQLENGDEDATHDANEERESLATEKVQNDDTDLNAYEREGLQFEEVGDYVYYPQNTSVSTAAINNFKNGSNQEALSFNGIAQGIKNININESTRDRSASMHSQLSYIETKSKNASYDGETGKYIWAPSRKIMTKKKYIREAIGCIKPLLENETWHGNVIATPCLAPTYSTNNPPISGILEELEKVDANATKNVSLFKYGFSQHDVKKAPKFKLILRKCKNHYLKQSVVGPSGYVRL